MTKRILTTSRRSLLTRGAALFATGFAAGKLLAPASVRAAQMTPHEKELYEAATKEGELTWYTSHSDDATAQALGRDFEANYPGMKVSVVRTTAQVAFQRVSQELKAGAMQVDVLSSTDLGHYVYLKEKGLLEKYVPDNAGKVLDIYKSYDPGRPFPCHLRGADRHRLQHRQSSRRPTRRRIGPSSRSRNGRIRSRSAIRASAAMSAPGP